MKISELIPDNKNANKGTERGRWMLENSLRKYGAGRSILIDKNGRIIAGNKTIETAAGIGLENIIVVPTTGDQIVAVQRTDLDLEKDSSAKELAIADNRIAQVDLDWSADVLQDLCNEIDLNQFWSAEELEALLIEAEQIEPGGGGDDFDVTPQSGETRCKSGDLWALGEHRLLCGDSTVSTDIEKLLNGVTVDMMFTDPPYGVDYTGGHFHSGDVNIKREREKLQGDANPALYADFLPVVLPHVDGPCYMWFAGSVGKPVYDAVIENQCEIHALIIWHKINATYAAMNAQYKQRHEPLLYFKPKGSTLRWCGATTESTLWEVKRDSVNEFHPTQKPIELAYRAINNHEVKTVLDVFAGSGSTLIAAHRAGRRFYGIEISPQYCDVIINRYEAETGQQARRIE